MTPSWEQLHDATLVALRAEWGDGLAVVCLVLGAPWEGPWQIEASEVRRIVCPREQPWGPSVSVNEVRLSDRSAEGCQTLEVEMQSGDILRIEARSFQIGRGAG
jgi:hypothetical protein